jgi:RecB family exonuclease
MDHISYSFLHLLACPYASLLRYEAGLRGPTTPPLALGSAIHHTLETAHLENNFNITHMLDTFKKEYNRIIVEEDVFVSYPQLRKLESEGLTMLEVYYAQIESGQITKYPLAVEKDFRIPIAGTFLVGRIDKIEQGDDGEYSVLDYKTGKEKPDTWNLRHNVQLTAYYWACYELYGKYPKKLIWHHLRTGELLETEREPRDVEQLKEMIHNAVTLKDLNVHHRVFHDRLCGWCDYRGETCDSLEIEKGLIQDRGNLDNNNI